MNNSESILIKRFNRSFLLNGHAAILLSVLLPITSLFAQYRNIKVWDAISSSEPQECSIVISPENTNNIMAASNRNHYYYSTDAGLTWKHGFMQSQYGIVGDPGVLAGLNGKYYYFHLVNGLSRVVCHKLGNISSSWSEGTYTGLNGTKQNDKDWGAINLKNNFLYLTWAQFDKHGSSNPLDSSVVQLSFSTDEGETWSKATDISSKKANAMAGNYSNHCPMPAIGPDNDVYVTWMGPEGLMFDRSSDGGISWLNKDINVTPYHIDWLVFNVPGVQRTPGFPVMSCDLSGGRYNGNIYICWSDQRSGINNTDIWICKSTDRGFSWSEAKRVNMQDEAAQTHQFFPWLTIDQVTGCLYVVYYDRSGYKNNETGVTMACSKNGGETFTYSKISETPFISTQSDFIGDYIGISAYNNVVRPIWTRVDNGSHSLWTAIADSSSGIYDEKNNTPPSDFNIVSVYPNPFNPSVKILYTLPVDGLVSLKVYDLLGNEITELLKDYKSKGSYEEEWDAGNVSSGTYLIRLQLQNMMKTHKIVLVK